MMSTISLVVFFLIFTTIDASSTFHPCKGNPNCMCTPLSLQEIKVVCSVKNNTMFMMEIKPWDTLTITCKNWEGWEDFYFTEKLTGQLLNSLYFKQCGLSNDISLKNVVEQFGVKKTSSLIFQSYKNLGVKLKKHYIEGFPGLKTLILSNNGFTNITKNFFWDCPELEYVDLSKNNLVIPSALFVENIYIQRIELGQNLIKVVQVGLLCQLFNLEHLNFTENELTFIKEETFGNLIVLKSLDLSKNYLTKLPQKIFYQLTELQILNLSFNNFTFIPKSLLKNNLQLKKLFLSNNARSMYTLPNNLLNNLPELEEVDLSGNGLSTLPKNIFSNSTSLKRIVLNANHLITLSRKIFKGLKSVEQLEINNNIILDLPERIFEDMKLMKKLDLSNNCIFSISKKLFKGLEHLHELNMEGNKLKKIDEDSLSTIKFLSVAKFSNNNLTINQINNVPWSLFYNNHYITVLDLSYNNIQSFDTDWPLPLGKHHLRLLNLSNNDITTVTTRNFIFSSENITIDLRYNKLRNISFDLIDELSSSEIFGREVHVYIDHNPLICDCEFYNLTRYFNKLMSDKVYRFIQFVSNNLTCINLNGTGQTEITKLNPKTYQCYEHDYFKIEPKCPTNCTCWIRPEDRVRIIDCSYKKMSEFWIKKEDINYIKDSKIIFDFTGNKLTKTPLIKDLEPMRVIGLLLSNNNISKIACCELPLSLKILELHNNNISIINTYAMDYLNFVNFDKLTLSGNEIICDCNALELLHYVHNMRHRYNDLLKLTCKDMVLPMYKIKNIKICETDIMRIYSLTTGVIVFILITETWFIYIYKQQLVNLI